MWNERVEGHFVPFCLGWFDSYVCVFVGVVGVFFSVVEMTACLYGGCLGCSCDFVLWIGGIYGGQHWVNPFSAEYALFFN